MYGQLPEDEEVNEIEVVVKSQREVTDKISMKPCERRGQDPNTRCIPVDGQKDETQELVIFYSCDSRSIDSNVSWTVS